MKANLTHLPRTLAVVGALLLVPAAALPATAASTQRPAATNHPVTLHRGLGVSHGRRLPGGVVLPAEHTTRPDTGTTHGRRGGAASDMTSNNWAGYVTRNGDFTTVSSDWVQPAVSCGPNSQTVFWVGLDGWDTGTVEQTGTGAYCDGGSAYYYAWWETFPANDIQSYNDTVNPGDSMYASVTYQGNDNYEMYLTDRTQGWYEDMYAYGANGASNANAEVIAEAPSGGGGRDALADFDQVHFRDNTVNGAALGTQNAYSVDMNDGTEEASTDYLGSNNENFTVTWENY